MIESNASFQPNYGMGSFQEGYRDAKRVRAGSVSGRLRFMKKCLKIL